MARHIRVRGPGFGRIVCLIVCVSVFPALGAVPLAAQQDATDEARSGPVDTRDSNFMQSVEDMALLNTDGERIGEIEEILVDENGEPAGFALEVGGFLGLAAKEVRVPLDALEWDGSQYVTRMTPEQLENLAPWQE